MAISSVSASADSTLNATVNTLINSMTLTPGAGDYLAVFTMDFDVATSIAKALEFSLFVGGTIVQHTERRVDVEGSIAVAGVRVMVVCTAQVTPTAGQAVEARYRISTDSATAKKRTLTLFPKASADFQQATGTSEVTVSSGTDTQVTNMTLTPGAGTYLLVFSTSATNVSVGASTNRIHYSVYVNGVQQAHTARRLMAEASISAALGCMPGLIACKVTPTAGQVVEIRAHRDGTLNWTIHERTLTLMKVADADIKEATATADEADTGVADELLTSMTLTDPGAADWLAIFSTSQFYGVIAAGNTAIYSLYNAGAQVAASERQMTHESSIDSSDYYAFSHGKITVAGATDDVELRWRGSSATSRTAHERTLVMVKEAAGSPSIDAATGVYTLTGVVASTIADRSLAGGAVTGSYGLTGVVAGTIADRLLAGGAATGVFTETGVLASLEVGRVLADGAVTGSYGLTGVAATFAIAGVGVSIDAATGVYTLTGVAAPTIVDRYLAGGAVTGAYLTTGVVVSTIADRLLGGGAVTGVYVLTGVETTLLIEGGVSPPNPLFLVSYTLMPFHFGTRF